MAIKTFTYHKRSTGMTGQVLSSPQIEKKLARVEQAYAKYHGVKLGRYALYRLVLDATRQTKEEAGGHIQHTAVAVAGIVLDKMHKELSQALKDKSSEPISLDLGTIEVGNIRDLARQTAGRKAKKVA
jgi:hypothetical protein